MTKAPKHPPLAVPTLAAPPHGFVREEQPRLGVGPFTLVPANRAGWALPGGGRATYAELALLARRCGWRAPALYRVTLTRRPGGPVSRET